MSDASLVVAGVTVGVWGDSATAAGLDLGWEEPGTAAGLDSRAGGNIIVPTSIFFPELEATLDVTRIDTCAFKNVLISITIPRHVQILCSSSFSSCDSLSSLSFETDPELTHIEAGAFAGTHLYLVVVPGSTLFIAGDAFPSHCTVTSAWQILMED
jgi:hypothetical protein